MKRTVELFNSSHESVCRFPARHYYLKNVLGITLPTVDCPDLSNFILKAPADEVSLIYASENLTQPSSMMGHTMLAIAGINDGGQYVEHSVSFFTELDTINIPKIMWDALVVGKKGYFSVQPLSFAMNNYLVAEQRNVWRYPVKLNRHQKALIHLHLWELKQAEIPYFFDSHNCATLSQDILAIAYPVLASNDEIITPLDVVRNTQREGAIGDATVYASSRWKVRLLSEFSGVSDEYSLMSQQFDQSTNGQLRLMQAHALNSYRLESGYISVNEWKDQKSSLPDITAQIDLDGYRSPLNVPKDSQWSLGVRNEDEDASISLSWMPASHTLEDDNRNYFSENELILGEISGSVNIDSGNTRLDRLQIYSVRSFIPYDELTGGMSGYLQFGFERYYDKGLSRNLGFLVSGGLGRTYALSRDFHVYGLLGVGAVVDEEQQFMQLVPEVGAYLYEIWSMKSWLSYKTYLGNAMSSQHELSFTHSILGGRDFSVVIDWNRRWTRDVSDISGELKIKFYY